MGIENKTIVIGHKNPDTDSICSVIAYTELKNKTADGEFVACRAGEISSETQYVLDAFEAEVPELVTEVAEDQAVILIDHNEKTQCADGADDAQIIEIIDHHKIGSIETKDPILFRNEPVGCSATIITKMYKEAGVEPDKKTAGLLLSAILSDTLNFRSPTCTDRDVETGRELASIAGVDTDDYAVKMFEAGEKLDGKTAEDIFYSDFKIFEKDDIRFGIGQASFMSQSTLDEARAMITDYIDETLAKDNTKMAFFMLTSIQDQSSRMIYAGEGAREALESGFDVTQNADEEGILLKDVVSRKKQLVPALMETV